MDRQAAAHQAQQKSRRKRSLRNAGAVVVGIVILTFLLSRMVGGGSDTPAPEKAANGFTYGTGACPQADGSSPRTLSFSAPPQRCIDPTKTYTATFDTSEGRVAVKLDTTTTPGTTNNFVVLARYHYYDGTELFRTDASIGIVQGGAPNTNSPADPGPGYDLPDEGFVYSALTEGKGGPYKYQGGDLIMARASRPNGGSAQFFFGANSAVAHLDADGVYVRFGSTTTGLDVLTKILALNDSPGSDGKPSKQVTIKTVTISES